MSAEPPEAPKKRAWFQLHLSTCVVLMVVAGVLVWANCIYRDLGIFEKYEQAGKEVESRIMSYGWPFPLRQRIEPDPDRMMGFVKETWHVGSFMMNALVALAILALIAIACECVIRRRARRSEGAEGGSPR